MESQKILDTKNLGDIMERIDIGGSVFFKFLFYNTNLIYLNKSLRIWVLTTRYPTTWIA